MKKLPRVYITVNPDIVEGKRVQTLRSMVTALDRVSELFVVPVDQIDFSAGTLRGYRRQPGGKFPRSQKLEPRCDLWIVYTDGYYLETAKRGFKRRTDFIRKQFEFYAKLRDSGVVSRVVNSPESEERTLKDWFARIDCEKLGIIPTFAPRNERDLKDLFAEEKRLIVKPIWGGASFGVKKLDSETDVKEFIAEEREEHLNFDDYVCQAFRTGDEKRLWFCGDDFVGGRIVRGRKTPWSGPAANCKGRLYSSGKHVERDVEIATRVWKKAGLSIGSVDFIGDEVNELNGCGTTFVYYEHTTKIVDARPPLVDYVLSLVAGFSNG